MGDNSTQINDIVNQTAIAIANWSTAMAVQSINWLMSSLGQSTEPDLSVIAPVYNRMLAIALLLVGAVIALALVEHIASGSLGLGIILRALAATFVAYAGLGVVGYVAGYSALLATTWSGDFTKLTDTLLHSVAVSDAATLAAASGPHVSTFGLIVTALSLCCLTVIVHLELVVRSALILTVTAFLPLVSVMAIWPRLGKVAETMAEFLIGLFLSKFVVATAVYVGFRLVVTALVSPTDTDRTENWMASGVAVLLIAAFSPPVIFMSLRFAHVQAGSVARSMTGRVVSLLPTGRVVAAASLLARPAVRPLTRVARAQVKRLNQIRVRP